MKLQAEYKTIIKALIISPFVGGLPVSLFFWLVYFYGSTDTTKTWISDSLLSVVLTYKYGLIFWAIAAPLALALGLFFIAKNQLFMRIIYALLVTPIPVIYIADYVNMLLTSPGQSALIGSFAFAVPSALVLVYLTSKIELPISRRNED